MLRRSISLLLAFASAASLSASAFASEELTESVAKDWDANLEKLYLHFHQNPELSFKEVETGKRMAKELKSLGYEVTTGVARTGVVAVLKNGEGPTVMVRADMDGLPVKEANGLDYMSKAEQVDIDGRLKPVMHACGHDVHVTSLIGTARQMKQRKDDWSGTLVLIGQPAEERISGARAMMDDGLYERFPKPDYALALHVTSLLPAGRIQVPPANAYASSDSVDITVYGIGGHGAAPHMAIDPVLVASQIVVSLQSIVSRTLPPREAGVITVGSIHGGTKHNIIGEEVHLQLTVRSLDPDVRKMLLDGIDRVSRGTALAMGVPEDMLPKVVRSKTETTPPTNNHPDTAARVDAAIRAQVGEGSMIHAPTQGMGAEDFAYFVTPETGVKGVYFAVGGGFPEDMSNPRPHHSPLFRVEPESAVTKGTEAMTAAALALFSGE
ncbi:MAG: amidohydrolase [Parvularculaceae bacterium]|nr:amidohydrolase [Parvularculaceae bacterium]